MFYFNYVRLCNQKGISPTAAAIEMGFNRSMVTRWGNGAEPRTATLQKIADYFGVSVSEFSREEQKNAPTAESSESEVDMKLREFAISASPEELLELHNYIEFIKSKRK